MSDTKPDTPAEPTLLTPAVQHEQPPEAPPPDDERRPFLGKVLAVLGIIGSVLFLLNLGLGVLFEIPDNLPLIGNLDEVAAAAILLTCLRYLGLDLLPFGSRRRKVFDTVMNAKRLKGKGK